MINRSARPCGALFGLMAIAKLSAHEGCFFSGMEAEIGQQHAGRHLGRATSRARRRVGSHLSCNGGIVNCVSERLGPEYEKADLGNENMLIRPSL